ncbi:MAG: hypothetical protein ACK4RM_01345 [Flavobacterium sp.]
MKKLIFGGLFLALVGIVFVGCNKEQIIQQNSSEIDESNQMQLKSNAVVYANLSCELPNGETGCQCTITQSDDDCELQTACTAQSSLPNYSDALEEMFTREEIQYRARNNVRITERELIEALKKDRFPLK